MVHPTRVASAYYHILANEACRRVGLEGVEGSTKSRRGKIAILLREGLYYRGETKQKGTNSFNTFAL